MTNQTLKDWRKQVRLPWNAKATFGRSDSHWWERFAVVVSALALIVSAAATWGTWRQFEVMQAQLTIGDRNRSIEKAMQAIDTYCEAVETVTRKKGFLNRNEWPELSEGIKESIVEMINQLGDLHLTFQLLNLWVADDERPVVDAIFWKLNKFPPLALQGVEAGLDGSCYDEMYDLAKHLTGHGLLTRIKRN